MTDPRLLLPASVLHPEAVGTRWETAFDLWLVDARGGVVWSVCRTADAWDDGSIQTVLGDAWPDLGGLSLDEAAQAVIVAAVVARNAARARPTLAEFGVMPYPGQTRIIVPGQLAADMHDALSVRAPDADPALFGPPTERPRERLDDLLGFPRYLCPGREPRIEVDGERSGGCRVRFRVLGADHMITVHARDHDREPCRDEESVRDICRRELEAYEVSPDTFEILPGLKDTP